MHDKERALFFTLLIEAGSLLPDVVAAILARSVAVWADFARCSIDTLAVFLAWLTIRTIARGDRGRGYEYGLGKLESMSSALLAGIFVLAALWVADDAIGRLREPVALAWRHVALAFVFNLIAIPIDGWLWRKNRRLAAAERSPVLEAETRLYAIKTLTDVLIAVVLAVGASLAHVPAVRGLDPVVSFVIAGVMVYSAYGILSDSVRDLLDGALEEALQLRVLRCLAAHFDDYRDLHGMRSRRAGNKVFIELFLEFDGERRMAEVQAIIDRIREEISRDVGGALVSVVPSSGPIEPAAPRPA